MDDATSPLLRWPWGHDETDADKRANIYKSGIGHASVPGCFAPNRLGLLDMAGNVCEWQDGLCTRAKMLQTLEDQAHEHLPKSFAHALTDPGDASDVAATRGSSWIDNDPKRSACSLRGGNHAFAPDYRLGFRVMLSHSNTNSET